MAVSRQQLRRPGADDYAALVRDADSGQHLTGSAHRFQSDLLAHEMDTSGGAAGAAAYWALRERESLLAIEVRSDFDFHDIVAAAATFRGYMRPISI